MPAQSEQTAVAVPQEQLSESEQTYRRQEQERRRRMNREHCSAVLEKVRNKQKVQIGEITDPDTKKKQPVTIPVPQKRKKGEVTRADRMQMEQFIKAYLLGVEKCAKDQALDQCEQVFGYNYRI